MEKALAHGKGVCTSVPVLERHAVWIRGPGPCLAFSFPDCVTLDRVLINLSGFEAD